MPRQSLLPRHLRARWVIAMHLFIALAGLALVIGILLWVDTY